MQIGRNLKTQQRQNKIPQMKVLLDQTYGPHQSCFLHKNLELFKAQFASKDSRYKSFIPQTMLLYGSVSVKTIIGVCMNHSSRLRRDLPQQIVLFCGGFGRTSAADHRAIHYSSIEQNSGRLYISMKSGKVIMQVQIDSLLYFMSKQCSLYHPIKPQQIRRCFWVQKKEKGTYYSYWYEISKESVQSGPNTATFEGSKMEYKYCNGSNKRHRPAIFWQRQI